MKSYSYFLLLFLLLTSCQKKHKSVRPIIFNQSSGDKSRVYLIVGSDTQQVDSVYKRYFNQIFYEGYGNEDTLYTALNIAKYYVPYEFEKEINNYVYNYFKPCLECKLNEMYVMNYYYVIATGPDGDSIQCCLYDQQHALSFYYGLKKLIDQFPYFAHNSELAQNFGPMINIDGEGLFLTPKDSIKALMYASEKDKKRYVEIMRQKREKYKKQFEWAQRIDSIKAAIAKDQTKDKQVD